MTLAGFRNLLRVWVVLVVLRLLAGQTQVPPQLTDARQAMQVTARTPVAVAFVVMALALAAFGLVGMYRLWKPAPYAFLASQVVGLLLSPLFPPAWLVFSAWELTFDGLLFLLGGALFATAVWGGLTPPPSPAPEPE